MASNQQLQMTCNYIYINYFGFIHVEFTILGILTLISRSYDLSDRFLSADSSLDGLTPPSAWIPLTYSDTSNVTVSTSVLVDKQCGKIYAFLKLEIILIYF